MGCGCGKSKRARPVAEDAPNPNEDSEASNKPEDSAPWQAHPANRSRPAVPMPS